MLNLILVWVLAVSFIILFSTLALRVLALREGRKFEVAGSHFYRRAQSFFDHLAFNLVQAFWRLIAKTFYCLITWSHRALIWGRQRIVRVERKVNKVVDVLNGKGEVPTAGRMSLFLREIDARK